MLQVNPYMVEAREAAETFDMLRTLKGDAAYGEAIALGVSAYRDKMTGVFRSPRYAADNALLSSQIMAILRTR
jgi:hypothetical protein